MSFSVNIDAQKSAEASSVSVSGEDIHIITDVERQAFQIDDNQLKKAVETYFGKWPNDAYLHSPTPWGDLYNSYGWPQVQVILKPLEAKILGMSMRPLIIKTQKFTNSSKIPATFDCAISSDVSDTVEANWSQTASLTFTQSINYGTKVLGGETSLSFTAEFQQGGSKSKSVTVGQTSGVMVDLDPGNSVIAELTAHIGTLQIQVSYEARLTGVSAVNYNPRFKGHHFWALAIEGVREAAQLPRTIKIVEDIQVNFYADGEIILKDAAQKRIAAIRSPIQR